MSLTTPTHSTSAQNQATKLQPSKPRTASTTASQPKDSVHFGMQSVETHDTLHETPQPTKPSLTQALWAGTKKAFKPIELAKDLLIGVVATVVMALIPPHLHALGVLPTWMAIGATIRGVQGVAEAYSQK